MRRRNQGQSPANFLAKARTYYLFGYADGWDDAIAWVNSGKPLVSYSSMVEQTPYKGQVVGSTPARTTKHDKTRKKAS